MPQPGVVLNAPTLATKRSRSASSRPSSSNPDLEAVHLLAAGDQQRLGARLDPLHRPPEQHRARRTSGSSRWACILMPKPPPRSRRDHADLALAQPQRAGERRSAADAGSGTSRGTSAARRRVPVGEVAARLERLRRVALDPQLVGETVRGRRERAVDVALARRRARR